MVALYLASTSPARAQIIADIGLSAEVLSPDLDEEAVVAEMTSPTAVSIAQHLAERKAESALAPEVNGLVIGGDSVFEFDGEFLGKPHTADVATKRWKAMRGRSGILHSGLCVIDHTGGAHRGSLSEVSSAEVFFRADVTDDEIAAYVVTGEPLSVAGAFTSTLAAPRLSNKLWGIPGQWWECPPPRCGL